MPVQVLPHNILYNKSNCFVCLQIYSLHMDFIVILQVTHIQMLLMSPSFRLQTFQSHTSKSRSYVYPFHQGQSSEDGLPIKP
jgi:hypothetical protein